MNTKMLSAVAVAVLAAHGRAVAQDESPDEDPRPTEAKAACASGRVDEGIEILGHLYAETDDTIWVFNQGRCYQQNGMVGPAILRFREFLRRAAALPADAVPAEAVQAAKGHLAALEADQRAAQALTLPAAPPPPVAAHRRLYRGGAIALAALGAAGMVTGVVFSVEVRNAQSQIENQARTGGIEGQDLMSKTRAGNRDEVLQWVGYGVGAVALAGSAAFAYAYLGHSHRTGGERALLLPFVAGGAAGAALAGRF